MGAANQRKISNALMIELLQKKFEKESVNEAYSKYFEQARMYEIEFDEHPFGFSVIKNENQSVHVFAIQKNIQKGMKIGSIFYEINGKVVSKLNKKQRLMQVFDLLFNKESLPFSIIFKECKEWMQSNIEIEKVQKEYWYNEAIISLFDGYIRRNCGDDIKKIIFCYFNCGDVAV